MQRDIIVIGASTGGLDALKQLVSSLPATLPAAVFIVLHQSDSFRSHLAELLRNVASLPVEEALHGEPVERGHIYVAPPDNHLMLREERLVVVRGPRENGHRPSVDALFRSAAEAYGSRVIGVILTGALDCGTLGLLAVKSRGGVGIAQDPDNALCRDMPSSAIRSGAVDHVNGLEDIAGLLFRLTSEARTTAMASANRTDALTPRGYSFITCPLCHGSLRERAAGDTTEFACHVGHAFSMRSLYAEQADQVEGTLWAALRALEESTALAERMAEKSSGSLKLRFVEKERSMRRHAATLRDIVIGSGLSQRIDVAEPITD
jgi:two-component system chemotaxis response regulator CheB